MPPTATRERSVSWLYGPDLTAPRKARHQVRKAALQLGPWGPADAAALILSELVTNAVSHGEGPVGMRISLRRPVPADGGPR